MNEFADNAVGNRCRALKKDAEHRQQCKRQKLFGYKDCNDPDSGNTLDQCKRVANPNALGQETTGGLPKYTANQRQRDREGRKVQWHFLCRDEKGEEREETGLDCRVQEHSHAKCDKTRSVLNSPTYRRYGPITGFDN